MRREPVHYANPWEDVAARLRRVPKRKRNLHGKTYRFLFSFPSSFLLVWLNVSPLRQWPSQYCHAVRNASSVCVCVCVLVNTEG
jgi:hypothetical protein